jgi:hypothetical protein
MKMCVATPVGRLPVNAIEKRFDCSEAKSNGYVVEIGSDNHVQNNKIRFSLYRMFTYEKFGCLGKGIRMKIPDCVEGVISRLRRKLY